MTDKQISREFQKSAKAIKRQYGAKAYHAYEARVHRAVRRHPPGCMCPFHGGHR